MENIGRAFSFMFEDKEWVQKILVGGAFVLLSCILIGIPFLIGYLLVLGRQSAEGKPLPLPSWDNLGEKFILGLVFLLAMIIYAIPLTILYFILVFIPCIGWLAIIVIGICFSMIVPYIAVRFARSGKLADAFDFSGMVAFFQKNFVNLLIVWAISIALQIIAYFGILALVIGVFFSFFWSLLGRFYLYGEVVYAAERKPGAVQGTMSGGTTPA